MKRLIFQNNSAEIGYLVFGEAKPHHFSFTIDNVTLNGLLEASCNTSLLWSR